MENLDAAVAEVLRVLSTVERVGPTELERRTGLEQSHISKLLNGKVKMSFMAADLIAHHLGTDLESVVKAARELLPDLPRRAPTMGETINRNIRNINKIRAMKKQGRQST